MSLTAAEGLGVAKESDRNWAMLQEEATSKDNNSTPCLAFNWLSTDFHDKKKTTVTLLPWGGPRE